MLKLSQKGLHRGLALLAVGAAGAWVATRLGIPAGAIIGALIASGLFRLASGPAGPWRTRYGRAGRLLLGTLIGAAFGPEILDPLKNALLPMTILIVVIVGVGLFLGWALSRFTSLDIATGLISCVPGGLPAMAAMADESEADVTVVTAIHFARLTTILVLMPVLIPFLASMSAGDASVLPPADPVGLGRTLIALGAGTAGALLAIKLNVPTGDLIGPILVVGGANLLGAGLGPLPPAIRTVAMILIGISAGAQVSRQGLRSLRKVALPAGAVILTLIGTSLILGGVLARVTSLDLASALLSSVPGGATTMPAVAHDLGGDMRLVAALHLTRQLAIFIIVPSVLGYLLRRRRREGLTLMEHQ